ncbi:MAG: GNAT family N-acetyltransferase [Bdellovibrio sp.]|nr:GNAT family N-acetyltransferase [Bdellovibrio sp.]
MAVKYIETERIYLREFEKGDELNLLELDSDPDVMRYLTNGQPSTFEQVSAGLYRIFTLYEKHQHRLGFWVAVEKSTGSFMGWFLFRPCKLRPDDLRVIELGYRLKKEFWGRGFATEMSKAIIDKGFREYEIDIIFAKTMKLNLASQKVMKKIGMLYEKDFIESEFPGANKEAVRYSMTREQWNKLVQVG